MATTKIWKIKNRFDNVINYVSNKDKTDNKKYVSGINCLPETAFKKMSIVKKEYNKWYFRISCLSIFQRL